MAIRSFSINGIPFDAVTLDDCVERIAAFVSSGGWHLVVPVNTDVLVLACRDATLSEIITAADLVLADGMPIVVASRVLGSPLPARVTGSDLTLELCRRSAELGLRLFLLGAGPGVAEAAKRRAEKRYPGVQIVGTYSPSRRELEDDGASAKIVAMVNKSAANVLLAAFGAPRQEKWLWRHRTQLETPVNIAVGAAIDFLAGRVRRAPAWMQRAGLEWLYRLLREPRRLSYRYLVRDPYFVTLLAREWLTRRRGRRRQGAA
ncbi:MAG: WecB/TagA/CpsF family glycosyltransferase [Clostridia bacterium]|nr:WecB/TagA/CpsF family glycosyltransferase [Clostridia bacterium]MDH7572252.1 WecB/TagA/CpsF family glycosyltransferase [Clostridia bacterium]